MTCIRPIGPGVNLGFSLGGLRAARAPPEAAAGRNGAKGEGTDGRQSSFVFVIHGGMIRPRMSGQRFRSVYTNLHPGEYRLQKGVVCGLTCDLVCVIKALGHRRDGSSHPNSVVVHTHTHALTRTQTRLADFDAKKLFPFWRRLLIFFLHKMKSEENEHCCPYRGSRLMDP